MLNINKHTSYINQLPLISIKYFHLLSFTNCNFMIRDFRFWPFKWCKLYNCPAVQHSNKNTNEQIKEHLRAEYSVLVIVLPLWFQVEWICSFSCLYISKHTNVLNKISPHFLWWPMFYKPKSQEFCYKPKKLESMNLKFHILYILYFSYLLNLSLV